VKKLIRSSEIAEKALKRLGRVKSTEGRSSDGDLMLEGTRRAREAVPVGLWDTRIKTHRHKWELICTAKTHWFGLV
jgi:hypothetical protein